MDKQRSRSLKLLIFSGFRVLVWTGLLVCVGLGLLDVAGFHWAALLAKALAFVTLISLYANWATDLGAFQAAYAAVIASAAHEDAEDTVEQVTELEADIAALARSGGPEAEALAASISERVKSLANR